MATKQPKQPKTLHALKKVLADAGLDFDYALDNDNQVVLYTGLKLVEREGKEVLEPIPDSEG